MELSHAQHVNFGVRAMPPKYEDDECLTQSECQNCGEVWPDDALELAHALPQRVEPGEPYPTGECPDCGCLCQPIDAPVYVP